MKTLVKILFLVLFFSFIMSVSAFSADWSGVPSWNPGEGRDVIKVVSAIEGSKNLVIAETEESLGNYYPKLALYTINDDGDKLSGPFLCGGNWTTHAYDGFSEYDSSSGKYIFNVFGYEFISYDVHQAAFFRIYEDGSYVQNGSEEDWHHLFNPEGEEFVDANSGYHAGDKLSNGNYLAVGYIIMPNADNTSINPLVVCFSPDGEVLWFRVLNGSEVSKVFDKNDEGIDFVEHNGHIYVLIRSESEGPGTEYNNYAYKIVRMSMDGSYLDSESFGYSGNDYPKKIFVYENDLIVYGYTEGDTFDYRIFLNRISPANLEELPTYPYFFDSFNNSNGHFACDMLINQNIAHMTGSMLDEEYNKRLFHIGFNLETKSIEYSKLVGEQAEGENIDYYGLSLLMTSDGNVLVGGSRCDVNGHQDDYFLSYLDLSLLNKTQEVSLNVGWNLISFYVQPEDSDISQVLAPISGSYSAVWGYDGSNNILYNPELPLALNDLKTIEAGKGYWIYATENCSFSVEGELFSDPIPIVSGWNFVGASSESSQAIDLALASLDGIYSAVWGYDGSNNILYNPELPLALNDLKTIEAGKGYWIYAIVSGSLIY